MEPTVSSEEAIISLHAFLGILAPKDLKIKALY